ncbi:hypothetical protein OsI_29248 [Oryza sativa Indica Group]|uniref:Uncharacterized protein n=1 Tax=Oryza sativa subsp. indica TaxID=39946 RepID=A2YV91_ORYSI|nr:hypothetical protein OsI_29248 [Oryza sativa Indica Group]
MGCTPAVLQHPTGELRLVLRSGGCGGGTIELSMIKTWLRSNQPQPQPSPPQHADQDTSTDASASSYACSDVLVGSCNGGGGGAGGTASSHGQSLALSMSTWSVASTAGGSVVVAAESSSSENRRVDSPGGAVPRKSIDTFGQRTSIYRAVRDFH